MKASLPPVPPPRPGREPAPEQRRGRSAPKEPLAVSRHREGPPASGRSFGRELAFAAALAALSVAGRSHAQQRPLLDQGRLPEVGRSVVVADDATALVLNPANLAFLPASEMRWTATGLRDEARTPVRGHALSFAAPLGGSLAAGVRMDFVNPPAEADLGPGLGDTDYRWLTLGLATRLSSSASVGFSYHHSYADGLYGRGLSSLSVGVSLRPFDFLALSFVGRDVNSPENRAGVLDSTYGVGLAVFPTRSRTVQIGLEAERLSEQDVLAPRTTLGVDIGSIGRARGELRVVDPFGEDPQWMASLGFAVSFGHSLGSTEVGVAGLSGNAIASGLGADYQISAASRAFRREPALRFGTHAVRLRMGRTPDERAHVRWLRRLWQLSEDPRLEAVVLDLRAPPAATLAHAEELRDAIGLLEKAGKAVLCHLRDAGGSALYVCAAARHTSLHPAGTLSFAGVRNRYLYFGRLLSKVGVSAEVIRVGEHKSAPETFTGAGADAVSRADKTDLLQQQDRLMIEGLASGLEKSPAEVRAALDGAPLMASQAKAAGLIDRVAFDDELDEVLQEVLGHATSLGSDHGIPELPDRVGRRRSVAVVYVDGEMVEGRSETTPLTGTRSSGSDTIVAALAAVRRSRGVGAVVLRIETPGGSAMAADLIWREVQRTARAKPVVVSMGGYAASGGYYIASPARRVFANPLSITGSIGVFSLKADASQLLDKLGIDVEVYKVSESADYDAPYRARTASETERFQRQLDKVYDLFLTRVAEGRNLSKEKVDEVARGRVWTGEQAASRGLVDEVGGLRQAIAYARAQAHLEADAPWLELPRLPQSLLSRLTGVPGVRALLGAEAERPPARALSELGLGLGSVVQAIGPVLLHGADTPLTRLDFTVQE